MSQVKIPSADTLEALETVPAMLLILSTELIVLTASNLFLQETGFVRENLMGRQIVNILENGSMSQPELGILNFQDALEKVIDTGSSQIVDKYHFDIQDKETPGGLINCFWECTCSPVFYNSGQLSYIILSIKNILEQPSGKQNYDVQKVLAPNLEEDFLRANQNLIALNFSLKSDLDRYKGELEGMERKYRDVIENSPIAMQVFRGENMTFEIVNSSMLSFLGKTEGIIGKPLFMGVPEIVGQPIVDVLYNVYRTGKPFEIYAEKVILERNGKTEAGYYDVIYRALYEKEQVTGVLGIAIDVTPQVLAQQAVLESEARFRNMAENSDILISLVDEHGTLEYVNASWADMTGWNRENLLQFSWSDYVHPEEREQVTENFIQGMNKKMPFVNEFRLLNKHGDYRWLRIKGTPRLDDVQSFSGFIFSGFDVSDEKQRMLEIEYINKALVFSNEQLLDANRKLAESEENLSSAFDAGELGSCSLDLKTGKAEMSERYRHLYGLPLHGDITWEMVLEAVELEFLAEVNLVLENAVRYGTSVDSTHAIRHLSSGERRWMRVVGKVYKDDQGDNDRVNAIVMDVTAQKEDEIRKNDFIAMVSHELKTPLTSMNGYIQLLQLKTKKGQGIDIEPILGKVQTQLKKMTTMINGFLSISRLESGKIHLVKNSFDISQITKLLVEEYQTLISTHDFVGIPCDELWVEADRDKIEHVINNLLSNAVKYSPKTSVIEINCTADEKEVTLSVKDHGMGVHEQDIPKLFDRYYRVHSQQTSTIAGFGIGLYLCAEIIHRHGGKIWVESEVNVGSTFYFSIPLTSHH